MSLFSIKTRPSVLFACLIPFVLTSFSKAQEPKQEIEYRLVSATKIDTFERELDELAKQGFQVRVIAQSMRPSSLSVLTARVKGGRQEPQFEYKLIEPRQLKKQKAEIEKAGFSCRGALLATALFGLGSPPLILLERSPAISSSTFFELIESNKEKVLQQKMVAAAASGFIPVSISPTNILMQRIAGTSSESLGNQDYRLIEVYRMPTLEKEMSGLAKDGYRYALSGALNSVIMKRASGATQKEQFEYRLVSLEDGAKSHGQLAKAVAERFNFVGVTQLGLTAIFERQANDPAPSRQADFKVLETISGATMEKELADAVAQGFLPLSIGHGRKGWMSILLCRENSKTQRD